MLEALTQRRLGVRRERVEPEVRGADVVGLLDDQLSTRVESSSGSREGEGDEEPQHGKDRAVDRADALGGGAGILLQPPEAEPAAELQAQQHAHEQAARVQEYRGPVAHVGSSLRGMWCA